MNRSTKGALAASAAGALLLGGAGSLAYWNSQQTIGGGSIASGELTLTQAVGQSCTDWTLDASGGTTAYLPGTTLVVPGDVITRTCDYTVAASGEHLAATLGMDATAITGDADLTNALTAAATYTLAGNPVSDGAAITSSDNGAVLHAVITVTFGTGTTGTTAQNMTASLADIVVGLTQTHA
ncbi:MAG TPA: alternate-type signal peptide domain-containing protein [Marmoricola sp.]|nr:alternate-type signal peptide domain-containing protein [Marmoricola sp.]